MALRFLHLALVAMLRVGGSKRGERRTELDHPKASVATRRVQLSVNRSESMIRAGAARVDVGGARICAGSAMFANTPSEAGSWIAQRGRLGNGIHATTAGRRRRGSQHRIVAGRITQTDHEHSAPGGVVSEAVRVRVDHDPADQPLFRELPEADPARPAIKGDQQRTGLIDQDAGYAGEPQPPSPASRAAATPADPPPSPASPTAGHPLRARPRTRPPAKPPPASSSPENASGDLPVP